MIYGTDASWMDTLYPTIPNLNELFYAFAEHPYWYGHEPDPSATATARWTGSRRRASG